MRARQHLVQESRFSDAFYTALGELDTRASAMVRVPLAVIAADWAARISAEALRALPSRSLQAGSGFSENGIVS